MHRLRNSFWPLFLGCLLCTLAACGTTSVLGSPSYAATTPATRVVGGNVQNTPPLNTDSVPLTQTGCPATGTGRAMVTAPLTLGHDQTVVYIVNEGQSNAPTLATLKRFDVVTGTRTNILIQSKISMNAAQLSADGQWILFVANSGTQDKLQLVRMDGQGLQTLYCAPSSQINSPQWSTNQQWIVFSIFSSQPTHEVIYLLDTSTGKLQSELTTQAKSGGIQGYNIRTWLDSTRIYLMSVDIDQPATELYILDITKGANQTEQELLPVIKASSQGSPIYVGDIDSSYDGKQLYVDHGVCGQGGCFPPSDISAQPALGGPQKTLFSSKNYDAISVRAISQGKLLVIIFNSVGPTGGQVDSSHNGLWTMNTDGSDLQRLVADSASTQILLNSSSQYPWSNVSRDGKYYAAQINNFAQKQNTFTLVYGSLSGGPATTFVAPGDGGTNFNVVGWTAM